jgi:hypothetical protein
MSLYDILSAPDGSPVPTRAPTERDELLRRLAKKVSDAEFVAHAARCEYRDALADAADEIR